MAKAVKESHHRGHVSDADAMLLHVERDPQLRSTITAVFVLDRVPDRAAVLDRLDRMSRSVPGYRHRLVTPPLRLATPRWVVDQRFRPLVSPCGGSLRPEPKTLDTVSRTFARQSGMSGLDPDRPLWTFTVVEGLVGGRAAVVVKLHHVLTDGVGGSMMPFLSTPRDSPAIWADAPVAHRRCPDPSRPRPRTLGTNTERITNFLRDAGGLVVAAPHVMRHPVAAAGTVARNVTALGRIMKPQGERLSPIMVSVGAGPTSTPSRSTSPRC